MSHPAKKQSPTFGPQSEIGEAAERIVQDQLAPYWSVRKRVPDIHIDFEIEQKFAGEPTALTAYVQVKGQRKCIATRGTVAVQIKTKHLLYWSKALRPVMLVVVDTTSRMGYFLFVQRWIHENASVNELARKSTHKIKVSATATIEDHVSFTSAVKQADRYLSDRLSTSPEKAIEFAERELVNLDPRFQVTLTASKERRTYTIAPVGPNPIPLDLTLPLPTDEVRKTANDVFAWGKPGKIIVQNTKIEGSPLFEHITGKNHWFELNLAGTSRPAAIRLITGAKKKQELIIRGSLSMGNAGIAFTSESNLPIGVNVTIPHGAKSDGVGQINFSADSNYWVGKRLFEIERLREIALFTSACVRSRKLETELQVGALRGIRSRKTLQSADIFETLAWWSGLLLEAVDAAIYYQLNPTIPDLNNLDEAIISATGKAISLAKKGGMNLSNFTVEVNADTEVWPRLIKEQELLGFVKMERESSVNLLGQEHPLKFMLEPVYARITRIDSSDSNIRKVKVSPAQEPHFWLPIIPPTTS